MKRLEDINVNLIIVINVVIITIIAIILSFCAQCIYSNVFKKLYNVDQMLCKSLFLYVSKLSVLTDFASVMHDRYQSYCGSVG